MLNHKVIDSLLWLWSLFDIKLLTFIAAGFTIYFGYQKVSKKVCISYKISTSRLYDTHIPALILSNKRDNSLSISSIEAYIEGKGKLTLINFDIPVLLKGYETQKIKLPKYSVLYLAGKSISLDTYDNLSFTLITTAGKEITCEIESELTPFNLNTINKITSTLNGIVLTNRMLYVFFYKINALERHCIIDKTYFINDDNPFHFNLLPDLTKDDFIKLLLKSGYHDRFDNYMCYRVQDDLSPELFFNKNIVESHKIDTTTS